MFTNVCDIYFDTPVAKSNETIIITNNKVDVCNFFQGVMSKNSRKKKKKKR